MKKTAIVLIMAVLFQGLAFAQLKLGVKAGANISNLSGYTSQDLINDVKGANSYQFGILAKVKLGDFICLQPEVLLSMKGAELANDQSSAALNALSGLMGGEPIPNSLHLKTTYLEVPLNIQAGIGLGSLARVYGQVSPYLSYLIADDIDGAEDFYAAYKDFLSDYDGQPLNSFDYGIGLGAGVEVLFLQLSVKYDFSLNEFKEVPALGGLLDDVNPLFSSLKHRNLSISLAFLF
ncbi:MAG: porin family protein [Bacteroidales bacterium]|nr:porin family protein [Bacteroidales bacterium]